MKYPTEYRYIAWDLNGNCYSYYDIPRQGSMMWEGLPFEPAHETLDYLCPGSWDDRYYDMEDENDRRFIECLMKL